MIHLEIYIDGASKGNPGKSGIGVAIYHNDRLIKEISNYIGLATNNVAEYTALIYALEEALLLKADSVNINTDSQLLARQLNKIYKVRNAGIVNLYNRAVHLSTGFKKILINHIPRENNILADKLASGAVKKKAGCGCPPILSAGGKSGLQRVT